jgi:hypothetical protein
VAEVNARCYSSFNEGFYARMPAPQVKFRVQTGLNMLRFSKFDFRRVLMRASVAGLLAACALIGIPRFAGELREYRRESQKLAPVVISVPPVSRPAVSAAPDPKVVETAALPKPAPVPKVPDAAVLPKLAPVERVGMQPDPSSLAGSGTKVARPANETELIPAIQKELTRLSYYDGPVTNKWSGPVRSAVREFFRKTGSRDHSVQPTARLLTALQAAESIKMQTAKPPAGAHHEEKPVRPSEPVAIVTPPQQNAAAPMPTAQSDDYLPPWMTAKTDQARFASNTEDARSDELVEVRSPEHVKAPSSADDTPRKQFHRRYRAERLWKGRRHYVSHRAYYSRRRAFLFPY